MTLTHKAIFDRRASPVTHAVSFVLDREAPARLANAARPRTG